MATTDDTQEHIDPTTEVFEREGKLAEQAAKDAAKEAKAAERPEPAPKPAPKS
jgi:hypothetical protein